MVHSGSEGLSAFPDEILIAIAKQVKEGNEKRSDLVSLLSLNKRWYKVAVPFLYGNLVLENGHSLEKFVSEFNTTHYATLIRSITLRINFERDPAICDPQSTGATPLTERIGRLTKIISGLQHLSCFSLINGSRILWTSLRLILVDLIDALPQSCTSLELDTQNNFHNLMNSRAHVCDSIRKILPKMRHMRLRLGAMCPAMLGTGKDDAFTPVQAPNLKSLVIDCKNPGRNHIYRCGWDKDRGDIVSSDIAWNTLTSAISKQNSRNPIFPQDAQVYAISVANPPYEEKSLQTFLRADLSTRETLALPVCCVSIPSEIPGCYLLRLPEGQEMMTTLQNATTIAEGCLWLDVVGGARLPAEYLQAEKDGLASFATGCIEKPAVEKTVRQWREDHPKKMCRVWKNEKLTGMTLLSAQKRVGDAFLDKGAIDQAVPEGWTMNDYGLLEQVDT